MPTNTNRSDWARAAVDAHSEATGNYDEPLELRIQDLLRDLKHLCRLSRLSMCFDEIAENAEAEYRIELDEDED